MDKANVFERPKLSLFPSQCLRVIVYGILHLEVDKVGLWGLVGHFTMILGM